MRVLVTTEQRIQRAPDGGTYSRAQPFDTRRYLSVFDEVTVVARVEETSATPHAEFRIDAPNVQVEAMPQFVGPWQYLAVLPRLRARAKDVIAAADAFVLRIPGTMATLLYGRIRRAGKAFAVEVVGDPYDVFAPGAVDSLMRPYFRWSFSRLHRRLCRTADIAAYVTERTLQRRYPPGGWTTHYSSLDLPMAWFVEPERVGARMERISAKRQSGEPLRLLYVGSLAQKYKAPDVLVHAVAAARDRGVELHLALVGEGWFRAQLEQLARELGIAERVEFVGTLPVSGIKAALDEADLFVLPSKTEGLPRVIVEAMARGVPCVATTVGGIPELLPAEDMVPPGDVEALTQKLVEVVSDPDRMERMARRNLERGADFAQPLLEARRQEAYAKLREIAEARAAF